jgi:hypothetical protein
MPHTSVSAETVAEPNLLIIIHQRLALNIQPKPQLQSIRFKAAAQLQNFRLDGLHLHRLKLAESTGQACE